MTLLTYDERKSSTRLLEIKLCLIYRQLGIPTLLIMVKLQLICLKKGYKLLNYFQLLNHVTGGLGVIFN